MWPSWCSGTAEPMGDTDAICTLTTVTASIITAGVLERASGLASSAITDELGTAHLECRSGATALALSG